jgi:hypothetical protein
MATAATIKRIIKKIRNIFFFGTNLPLFNESTIKKKRKAEKRAIPTIVSLFSNSV